jgi:septal ring factor EnvC (AmiA/AmiB activator)
MMKLITFLLMITSFIGFSWLPLYAELKQADREEWLKSKHSVLSKIDQIKTENKRLNQQLESIGSDIRAIDGLLAQIDTKRMDCELNKAAIERLQERLRAEQLQRHVDLLKKTDIRYQQLQNIQQSLQQMFELISRTMKYFHCMQMKPIQNQR